MGSKGMIHMFLEFGKWLQEIKNTCKFDNLKRNWFYLFSAMAFFGLNALFTKAFFTAMAMSLVLILLVCLYVPSLWNWSKIHSGIMRITALLSAVGIVLGGQAAFVRDWGLSYRLQVIDAMMPAWLNLSLILSYTGAVFGIYFAYICVLLLYEKLLNLFREWGEWKEVSHPEGIFYLVLFLAAVVCVVLTFYKTQAFYRTHEYYDVIYTSDSPILMKGYVYLALTHQENDLRQPLFAVFSAPFIGLPYLLGRIFGVSSTTEAVLMNVPQLAMLFAANILLALKLKLSGVKRICFVLLSTVSYSFLLSCFMMEQYIIAYFWLILCICSLDQQSSPQRFLLWGAGGTLMTSLVLLPFMSKRSWVREFKYWFADMVKYGMEFLLLLIFFSRFDVIINLISRVRFYSEFAGKNITLQDKFFQYSAFVRNCLMAPIAGVDTTTYDRISWQMNSVESVSVIGCVLFVIAIVSAVWNRKNKLSVIAGLWVVFSGVMLFGLGWGTHENGLILYVLYFGWAFQLLLFQFVDRIGEKIGCRLLLPGVTAAVCAVLAWTNAAGILEMIRFGITHYPV